MNRFKSIFFLIFILVSSCKKDAFFDLSVTEVTVGYADGRADIVVTSNIDWSVSSSEPFCTVTPSSGSGNAIVLVSMQDNFSLEARTAVLTFNAGQMVKTVDVGQEPRPNSPPDKPILLAPQLNEVDISIICTFKWSECIDPDGDAVTYTFRYSTDRSSWITYSNLSANEWCPNEPLESNTTYYWRVTVQDDFGAHTESDEGVFTTDPLSGAYRNGAYVQYQASSSGLNPIHLVFIGDGYLMEDFVYGGPFDQDMDQGIEAFFAVEPYKTYREYFTVYKVAAYSQERGASEEDKGVVKNTAFNATFKEGTRMSCNNDKVFTYAKYAPGITNAELRKMTVVLVPNLNRYGGTCWMWSDGMSIAICPVSRQTGGGGTLTSYANLIAHEAGGHGFGQLGDEYVNEQTNIPQSEIANAESFMWFGFYSNISFTNDLDLIKWRHFFDTPDYSRVGVYEGALYYGKGVWRPELSSCMINNETYYNAPSREAIVKRICAVSGQAYSFEEFVYKDIQKMPNAVQMARATGFGVDNFIPLAPPVLIEVK